MSNELASSFTTLFGPIDHAEGNEARSVLSPAAYLVDLLQLRDSVIHELADYHVRRPDVQLIPLDQANTFTEIPYLDVANDVMGTAVTTLVTGDIHNAHTDDAVVSGALAGNVFPPPLPFAEQDFRLRLYTDKLGTSLDEIQRLYRASVDAHTSARLRLGLSQEEYTLFSTAQDVEGVKQLWGMNGAALPDGSNVELIKDKLGLSLKELKQLVRQDLSAEELNPSPSNVARSFFINAGGDHIILDDTVPKLHLQSGATLTAPHLDRMMRFVRLARRLGLELGDLDWLIQTACGSLLDSDGLQSIAIALDLRKVADVEIDELCTLWHLAKDHGKGDGKVPADLFDRIYNNDFAVTLATLVARLVAKNASADALDDRLQATLRLTGADFAFLKAALLARGVAQPAQPLAYGAVVAYFSTFRRFATLAALLSLGVQDVVMLLDVLGA
jgi:hypothetical protein